MVVVCLFVWFVCMFLRCLLLFVVCLVMRLFACLCAVRCGLFADWCSLVVC